MFGTDRCPRRICSSEEIRWALRRKCPDTEQEFFERSCSASLLAKSTACMSYAFQCFDVYFVMIQNGLVIILFRGGEDILHVHAGHRSPVLVAESEDVIIDDVRTFVRFEKFRPQFASLNVLTFARR